jgi:uncharacterized iron-regulated membrane protein
VLLLLQRTAVLLAQTLLTSVNALAFLALWTASYHLGTLGVTATSLVVLVLDNEPEILL